jgi:2-polyprenyl-6-methoxyphenol hydroxylase-like FAD-dependent oxidoreductase
MLFFSNAVWHDRSTDGGQGIGLGKQFQIVIVGGGPVGAALAVNLGLRGIKCALVERHLEPQRIPKGQNLTPRSVEHFYFWGIADELRAARLMSPDFPKSGIVAYGSLDTDHWYAPPQRELLNPYYFQENERLPQYRMEKVLRRKLSELSVVETWFGWSAVSLEQDGSGVRVSVARRDGSGNDVLEADYVVGCDGSNSLVREQVGITRSGADFDQLMVLAVFRSAELNEKLKRFPPRSTYRVMRRDLKGYWEFFGRVNEDGIWFFHAPVPADTTRDNYDFHGLLQRVAGFDFACEFEHVGFWDLRVAVADSYQAGRVFIAGDAAHSHPPYGGFGLNNGLEDSVNLGWKLAATLDGWGSPVLLRSYGEERQPIFRETGDDFISARIEGDRDFFDRYDPAGDRAAFEKAWKEHAATAAPLVLNYEPNYEGSSIIAGPPGGSSSAHGTHEFTARAGHHLPPQPLSMNRNVFEELSDGFTLLAFDADEQTVSAFDQAARRQRVPLKIVRDTFGPGPQAYGARHILVRPDQYVAWIGDTLPDDAAALVANVTGRRMVGGTER